MTNDTLVSVILTTYTAPNHLERALRSVLAQTHKNLQILVVDGANDFRNKEVIERLQDGRIMYIYCKSQVKKKGMYGDVQVARNIGLKYAAGEYVAMLDDDDFWVSHKIEIQLPYIINLGAALVSCYTMTSNGHVDKPILEPSYADLLRSFNMSCTSSYLINRLYLKAIGGFDIKLRSMHEYDIALKFAKAYGRILVVPIPLLLRQCDNEEKRKFYYIKIAEVMDLYRLYGRDFIPELGLRGFAFNVTKSMLLVILFLLGFLFKEKVWKIIFKLKEMYQEKSK